MHFSNRQLFYKNLAQTSQDPLAVEISGADGIYLFDEAGKPYIDLISGIAVSSLGHNNKSINQAVKNQLDKHLHVMVYGEYINAPQVQYAAKICEQLPKKFDNVYFTNSGSEATELGIKLAKRISGRNELISFKHAYHGSTNGALSLLGDEYFKSAYRPLLPECRQLDYGNFDQLSQITEQTAAVFIEPIQAEAGIIVPTKEYIAALKARCKAVNCLLVFDECQTAFGRTGKLFSFEWLNVEPDLILLAKALGAGLPLGAVVCEKELMQVLTDKPVLGHISTFGGHPLSCAAGLAGLLFLLENGIANEVESKGQMLEEGLNHLGLEIRRAGLLMCLVFENEQINQAVIQACLKQGLLTDWFLFAPDCLRIAPPLTISQSEIRDCIKKLNAAIDEVLA